MISERECSDCGRECLSQNEMKNPLCYSCFAKWKKEKELLERIEEIIDKFKTPTYNFKHLDKLKQKLREEVGQ